MLNKGYNIGATVMDLPKVFGTLNQNILFKIKACGFNINALTLIQSYFLNRHQIMIKISDKFSKWKNISTGVPQVSILGPLLSNTLLMISFFILKLLLYEDGNAMYSSDKDANRLMINRLRHNFFHNFRLGWVFSPDQC